jgi:hypothetical protein
MRKYEGRLVGIFGTIIFHLIAGIIFMSFQIRSIHSNRTDEFLIEIAPIEESEKTEKLIELPKTTVGKILQEDDEMMNIARNLANKSEEKINPAEYIDKVKEELIKSGKLGADNYIDEQKRIDELLKNKNPDFKKDTTGNSKVEKPTESQKLASNFKGPTRIYYDLTGRTHTYLPIPIYKCQGSGKIVLTIEVNQKGIVVKAFIIENQSTTADACLRETALKTAFISRFNSDYKSPITQTGTLSYQFVAQ